MPVDVNETLRRALTSLTAKKAASTASWRQYGQYVGLSSDGATLAIVAVARGRS